MIATLLAQQAPYFIRPLPVWDYWWLLLLPLCLGISIVYKSIKCKTMATVAKESAEIFCWILLGMTAAAAVLYFIVWLLEQ